MPTKKISFIIEVPTGDYCNPPEGDCEHFEISEGCRKDYYFCVVDDTALQVDEENESLVLKSDICKQCKEVESAD